MMKKAMTILLSALLLLTAVVPVAATSRDVGIAFGDANGDGAVNARDAALLQQYVAGWDVTLIEASADANGDGAVNARDAALLQQYVAGLDVTLGADFVELPANGYDLDGRGRTFAESITRDGNIITVEIANRAKNWITEETSYVKYICTDAAGNVLTLPDRDYGYLYFGMLEVGESRVISFALPEGTTKVEFGQFRIVYWTPWV